MDDLQKRFGKLLAAHRRRLGITQAELADRASVSTDLISKAEIGATGISFGNIQKFAAALDIDPAELFTANLPNSVLQRGTLGDITVLLSGLSREDQVWIKGVIEAALKGRR
ncbi:hypothetical protein JP74_00490 [Devosia sp. 17-2-E-8]|nr:hypothetical protein JP74_00490 [Devosia sp. 17-2-E-8]